MCCISQKTEYNNHTFVLRPYGVRCETSPTSI